MSHCRKEGKDKIIFATEEYLSTPSNVELLPDNPEEIDTSNVGAILPNGEINWDCPCLGNLPNGPCGQNFREAFSCWVEYKDSEEGFAENCFENFSQWEKCLSDHRDIYHQGRESNSSAEQQIKESDVQPALEYNDEAKIKEDIPNMDTSTESNSAKDSNRAIAAASAATSK